MTGATRWLEKTVGQEAWADCFGSMERRFLPERDLPLIAYEAQWSLLDRALRQGDLPQLKEAFAGSADSLRNDARIVIEKLAGSQALLIEIVVADDALPYYTARDVFRPEQEYLYVDFGDQEPLEEGALMFGRFLRHENCLYVIPGVFVGTADATDSIVAAILDYLPDGSALPDSMQNKLPEIWNLCASIQDELDSESGEILQGSAPNPNSDELYAAKLELAVSKLDAVSALRANPVFVEVDPPEFGVDPFGESVFEAHVLPEPLPPSEEFEDFDDEQEQPIKVGTLRVFGSSLEIRSLNPAELGLLKALVQELVPCQ